MGGHWGRLGPQGERCGGVRGYRVNNGFGCIPTAGQIPLAANPCPLIWVPTPVPNPPPHANTNTHTERLLRHLAARQLLPAPFINEPTRKGASLTTKKPPTWVGEPSFPVCSPTCRKQKPAENGSCGVKSDWSPPHPLGGGGALGFKKGTGSFTCFSTSAFTASAIARDVAAAVGLETPIGSL